MPHGSEQLTALVVLIGTALLAGALLRALRAPLLVGFLMAGVLIGPSGLRLIDTQQVSFSAELGLVLLLFTVGLELSPDALLQGGWRLSLAGGLQIGLTAALAASLVGLTTAFGWGAALLLGLAVSFSSTPIVLKQLSDRGETDSAAGVVTTAILLLQDLVAILLLILLPLMAGSGQSTGLMRTWIALAALPVVFWVGRMLMPRVVALTMRLGGRELLTMLTVLMACLGAWLAELGHLSWPVGAFLAGLLLSLSDSRHQIAAEIAPFRDVFNALFFISIGMLVELDALRANLLVLAVLVPLILAGKALLTLLAVRGAGWPARLALQIGLGLCTMSEFGFVLAKEGVRVGVLSEPLFNGFVGAVVGTMFLGALLVPVAPALAARLTRDTDRGAPSLDAAAAGSSPAPQAGGPGHATHDWQGHVVLVGFGLNGQNVARVLRATGIRHVVVEMNPGLAAVARSQDVPVVVGDATRFAILRHARLHTARAAVVAINDAHATRRIVSQARGMSPSLYILARTRFVAELDPLYRLGADRVIPEEFETSIEIFAHLLKEFAVPDNVIEQQVQLVRAGRYSMLRRLPQDRTIRAEWLAALEATATQTYLLHAASPAAGRTIRELDLRQRTGVSIVAITRRGKPMANPAPDLTLEADDVLVLVGAHAQLDRAKALLDPPAATNAVTT